MDAYRAIVTKRDTRAYAPTPIPEEPLRRVLQAGRMAGSAKNLQPCRFVVVREQARKAELASCGQFAAYIPTAAALIAVVIPEDGREFDAGRAAQNIMLAAWNEGIASCPVTMHDQACALRVLGVPVGHRVAIVLALGYPAPAGQGRAAEPRRPFEEYVHWERW